MICFLKNHSAVLCFVLYSAPHQVNVKDSEDTTLSVGASLLLQQHNKVGVLENSEVTGALLCRLKPGPPSTPQTHLKVETHQTSSFVSLTFSPLH